MIKTYKVKAELFWDASNYKTVIVKANTTRKAIEKAKEKFKKKYNCGDMITNISVEEV